MTLGLILLRGCHQAILRTLTAAGSPASGTVPRCAATRDDVRVTTAPTAPAPRAPRRWHAEHAWLARGAATGGLARDVLIEAHGERFTAVTPNTPAALVPLDAIRLRGLTLPGLANAHSHAF